MSMIAVVWREWGGLQEVAAVATGEVTVGISGLLVVSLSYCCTSGPRSQEVGLLAVLPPMVLARVALDLWPSFGLEQVALEWPSWTR